MFTRKKKFFVLSAAILFVSCLFLSGCGSEQNQQSNPSDNNQTPSTQNSTDMNSRINNTPNTGNPNGMNNINGINGTNTDSAADSNSLHARAEKIADAVVTEISDVKDARVIISNKMAYVSVSISETADASAAKTLKEEIGQIVKKTDTAIEDVYVMEDADTFTRMKEMVEDIADGKPVSGFVEELDNMFTRVVPSKE